MVLQGRGQGVRPGRTKAFADLFSLFDRLFSMVDMIMQLDPPKLVLTAYSST